MAKNLLISKDAQITIKFALAEGKDGELFADVSSSDIKEVYGDSLVEDSIEEFEAVFRMPNFADSAKSSALISTEDGVSVGFNPMAIRMERIKRLIKSWTLKDAEGNPIEPSNDNIDSLNPIVANIIGIQLDAAIGVF